MRFDARALLPLLSSPSEHQCSCRAVECPIAAMSSLSRPSDHPVCSCIFHRITEYSQFSRLCSRSCQSRCVTGSCCVVRSCSVEVCLCVCGVRSGVSARLFAANVCRAALACLLALHDSCDATSRPLLDRRAAPQLRWRNRVRQMLLCDVTSLRPSRFSF